MSRSNANGPSAKQLSHRAVLGLALSIALLTSVSLANLSSHKPGETFKDCLDCPEMVVIPEGHFIMGSSLREFGSFKNEGPQHRVAIGYPLAVGKYEITVSEFARFATETGHLSNSGCYYFTGKWWDLGRYNWKDPGFSQTTSDPVVCVTWTEANAYAAWLSKKTRKRYRLLSEAEWEYVARSGTMSSRPWGSKLSRDNANYGAEGCCQPHSEGTDRSEYTAPVGSFAPNKFGLYDMMGNVWEWVDDCWHANYDEAPSDGSSWQKQHCAKHVIRGGSWYSPPERVRSAVRYKFGTNINRTKVGFRIARTL